MMIASPVGPSRPNRAADVRAVQMLLNGARPQMPGQRELRVDGLFGPETGAAINRYQAHVLRFARPDGVVDPGGPTLRGLGRQVGRPIATGRRTPSPPVPVRAAGRTPKPQAAPVQRPVSGGRASVGGLTEAQFAQMAATLDCEIAAIKAVVATEAVRGAFDEQGRPTILFERHKFYHHTNGRFATSDPDICNATRGGYGKFSAQYPKLERAMKLDRAAALKSASWGAFQILGENHVASGHATVESFVDAMKSGTAAQTTAFLKFVRNDSRLLSALRARDWATFARIYNGPKYRENNYDGKMRSNYQRYAHG